MRDSVKANFSRFNVQFEGRLPYMYTDALGLVTTGMGNLIDPVGTALALPWRNADGSLADAGTVQAQWQAVKDAWPGVQSVACGPLTTIRLDDAGIEQAIDAAIEAGENELRKYFPKYDSWPADGQMALLSMMWAMGGGFPASFPQFTAALNQDPPQFALAAAPSESNPDGQSLGHFRGVGIASRIAANDILWTNAQTVVSSNLFSDETFYYPGSPSVSGAVAKAGSILAAVGGLTLLALKPEYAIRALAWVKGVFS